MSLNPLSSNTITTGTHLIRSQSVPPRQSGSTAENPPVTATQIPKADKTSRNNSHNTWEALYSGERPLALAACGRWTL